jgi:anti-sigma B factor antagonist
MSRVEARAPSPECRMIRLKCIACGLTVAYRQSRSDLCPRCLAHGQSVQLLPVSDRPSRASESTIGRLSINAKQQDGRHTLFLKGEIDVASAPMLEAAIDELCLGGANEIVLDLCGVEFVDSSGLSAILHGKSVCEEQGCAYSLTPAQRPVERVFDMTGVKGRLHFRPRKQRTLRPG